RYLYEQADRVRITALAASADAELAGLAAKIDREEVYHRLHAELWADRLRDEPRFAAAVEELWPYALGMLPPEQRGELARLVGRTPSNSLLQGHVRGTHSDELEPLWLEMTEVRRSVPGAQW
ncbi:MAG TPA: Phenylacetic acid catabolic protein, partial [Gaiellaceae bacterium]